MSVADPSVSLTSDEFRVICPEFADLTKYPDQMVSYWIGVCPIVYDTWGTLYNPGQAKWTAHELKIMGAADGSGGLGGSGGPIQSKSVGPVSVSYDLHMGEEEGAGYYNMTGYGRQFIHWARLLGMGPIQVGAVSPAPYGTYNSWVGPPPIPGWFG